MLESDVIILLNMVSDIYQHRRQPSKNCLEEVILPTFITCHLSARKNRKKHFAEPAFVTTL